MSVLKFILQKEFRQIFRDRTILVMMFAMPTIQLIVVPLAMNFDVKNVNISVVDHYYSTYSQKLITKIGASGYFRIVSADPSFASALQHIEKEEADLVMEIPSGFERNLVREGVQKIGISVDAINGTKASIGGGYLNAIIGDFNAGLTINNSAAPAQGVIDITYSNWFNPLAEYKYYI